jgi:hypothetical protein
MRDDAPLPCQDIPSAVLSALYIVETGGPPSTIVLLSFATSLVYLGCALLVPPLHATRQAQEARCLKLEGVVQRAESRIASCGTDLSEVQV